MMINGYSPFGLVGCAKITRSFISWRVEGCRFLINPAVRRHIPGVTASLSTPSFVSGVNSASGLYPLKRWIRLFPTVFKCPVEQMQQQCHGGQSVTCYNCKA
jgi:hypothetical protein